MNDTPPLFGDELRWIDELKDLPPVPHHMVARYDVPPGKAYRYWDTDGRLIIYVNRTVIELLPRRQWGPIDVLVDPAAPVGGIPVRYE